MSGPAITIPTCPHPPGWDLDGVMALAQGRPVPRDRVLRLAAFLVEQVAGTLDTRATPCRACGLKVAHTFNEKMVHDRIKKIPGKLLAVARELAE